MNLEPQLTIPYYIPKNGGAILSIKEWYMQYSNSLHVYSRLSFDEFVGQYLIQLF